MAAAVAHPTHAFPGSDMTPSGFAARRPNAPSLPNFELPPPMAGHQRYPYASSHYSAQGQTTSFGNLLTPPSNAPGEAISPATTSVSNSGYGVQPHSAYVWSSPQQNTAYGFQPSGPNQHQNMQQQRQGSYGFIQQPQPVRINRSPNLATAGPASQYEVSLPPFPGASSGPMSAPATLPTMPSHSHNVPMAASTPVSSSAPHQSPVHAQDGFRPPPTPTYYNQTSATPQQPPFPYSAGPSPTLQSPLSTGGSIQRTSPSSGGQVPSLTPTTQSPHAYQRSFASYALSGPVLSNIQNPNGQTQLVNGAMGHGLPIGFNSGMAAHINSMYPSGPHPHSQQPPPQNDRPFRCDQCKQSFNRNHDLKRHKRIHLAVKPFPCQHCDKAFSRKDALKVRERIQQPCMRQEADLHHSVISSSKAAAKLVRRVLEVRTGSLRKDTLPTTAAPSRTKVAMSNRTFNIKVSSRLIHTAPARTSIDSRIFL